MSNEALLTDGQAAPAAAQTAEGVSLVPDGRVVSLVEGGVEPIYDTRLTWQDQQRDFVNGLTASAEFTPDEAEKVAGTYSNLFAAFSMKPDQAGDMFGVIRSAHQAAPSAEEQKAWRTQAQAALVDEFGRDGAAQALRDADKLLSKNPTLRNNLTKLKIGSHPRVVLALADRAREAKKRGTL